MTQNKAKLICQSSSEEKLLCQSLAYSKNEANLLYQASFEHKIEHMLYGASSNPKKKNCFTRPHKKGRELIAKCNNNSQLILNLFNI